MKVFDDAGNDIGWINGSHNWWHDPNHEQAFKFYDPTEVYPSVYFNNDHGVTASHVDAYVSNVLAKIGENPFILEIGCAGGWFTHEFLKRGAKVYAIDGSQAAVNITMKRCQYYAEIKQLTLMQADARTLSIDRFFDAIVCSEVAEHIEPPLSGLFVKNLTELSNVIFWSHATPGEHAPAHVHHPNEQPDIYWINLFKFFGYKPYKFDDYTVMATKQRLKYIFVKE
jgi:2-polyprenyl-3-methyl-5-hydroxy-6-metoxy-1,4-benzoquinol methylase